MDKVILFVEIDVKLGKRDIFVEKLKAHAAHIRTEDGCETLEIFSDTVNLNKICVWEIWTNRAKWDSHMANEASKAWQKIASEYVNGEKITVMYAI